MDTETIGKFIKNLRIKEGLTQEAFANMFGVTYQAVSKWENGKNIPDIAILKAISKKFNVPIDEILEGVNRKKRNNLILIIGLIIVVIGLLVGGYFIIKNKNFEFKKINTTCSDFKISGSAAYNSDHTSIYISNIDYCGKEDKTVYSQINCTLIEKYNGKSNIISVSDVLNNATLDEIKEKVTLNVDNYSASCKMFKSSELFLEIKAMDGNKIVTYNVPLILEDNC